jgi:histidinol-phosphate aminotransferase
MMWKKTTRGKCPVVPSPAVAGVKRYSVPASGYKIDLWLDANEGRAPSTAIFKDLAESSPVLAREYPSAAPLEKVIAGQLGVDPAMVLATSGGDDALFRACLSVLHPGREMILPVPTFEMFPRYAKLCGADAVTVPWPSGPFPRDAVLGAINGKTSMIVVVSPNNPTGAVASAADLKRISRAAPRALLVVDLAYSEFADEDLMPAALSLPNALAVRSMSKAWGMAGLRVGYAVGPAEVIGWLRAAGSPYALTGFSAVLASNWLVRGRGAVGRFVRGIKKERARLHKLLLELGADPLPSQANFVLCRFGDAGDVWRRLAGEGISVRIFPGKPGLEDRLRITCPGDEGEFARLEKALKKALKRRG